VQELLVSHCLELSGPVIVTVTHGRIRIRRSNEESISYSRGGKRVLTPFTPPPFSPRGRRAFLGGLVVWIEIHTTAVAWNLFHAEATRVASWERLCFVVTTCGLKTTRRCRVERVPRGRMLASLCGWRAFLRGLLVWIKIHTTA
jgi:hypothetical protein